jgi:RNA polymerase sigma-70 factor (ECF subfamily)
MDEDTFVTEFTASFRLYWLIAVGIVGDSALAEDVVQEAAIVALGKLDQYQPGTSFNAWLGQMVRYVALNEQRKQRRRSAVSLDPATMDQSTPDTSAAPGGGKLRLTSRGQLPPDQAYFDDRVLEALGEVKETARACLLLRTVEGLDYAEISRLLEIPEGTAMSHVHRTRKLLRQRLAEMQPGTGAPPGGSA